MSKRHSKLLPAALATTLAFGAAPFAVSANVNFDTLGENFPATADWTEDNWNTYLGDNFGTDLTDYESNEQLMADLGDPVDINAWISDQSDANILDAMERYDISSEQLAQILENNDYRDNIHFIGDLENVLETEGFTEVNAPAVTEEPVTEEEPIDDELADAEVYDDTVVDGEEAVEEATSDTTTEEPTTTTEEPTTTTEETTTDQGLTDENLSSTLYMYGLTEDDYLVFLEENGYAEGDFSTVGELESALEDAGYTVVNAVDGEEMPDTATNSVQNALIGTGIALLGAAAFFTTRRREGKQQ